MSGGEKNSRGAHTVRVIVERLGGGGHRELLVAPRGDAEGVGGGGGFGGVSRRALVPRRLHCRRKLSLRVGGSLLELRGARGGGLLDELRALALQRGVRLGGERLERLFLLGGEPRLELRAPRLVRSPAALADRAARRAPRPLRAACSQEETSKKAPCMQPRLRFLKLVCERTTSTLLFWLPKTKL